MPAPPRANEALSLPSVIRSLKSQVEVCSAELSMVEKILAKIPSWPTEKNFTELSPEEIATRNVSSRYQELRKQLNVRLIELRTELSAAEEARADEAP